MSFAEYIKHIDLDGDEEDDDNLEESKEDPDDSEITDEEWMPAGAEKYAMASFEFKVFKNN